MRLAKYISLAVIFNIIGWFVIKYLLVLEFLLKPYTKLGMTLETIFTHVGIIILITWFCGKAYELEHSKETQKQKMV